MDKEIIYSLTCRVHKTSITTDGSGKVKDRLINVCR